VLSAKFYPTSLSWITPYVNEINGILNSGFCSKGWTNYNIFCIHHILEKKWEYNGSVHQLFIDFRKSM